MVTENTEDSGVAIQRRRTVMNATEFRFGVKKDSPRVDQQYMSPMSAAVVATHSDTNLSESEKRIKSNMRNGLS